MNSYECCLLLTGKMRRRGWQFGRDCIYVQSVGGILEAVAIHEFLGGDRCARPLRESGDAFELDLAVKLLERSAVFFALLHRCLGHLIGKGGPPRHEEKDQVDDFHRLVIPVADIAMPPIRPLTFGGVFIAT